MRWKTKLYKDGDTRIIKKFLIFPSSQINEDEGIEELRWLETARIRQIYRVYTDWEFSTCSYWEDVEFVDE